MNHVYSSGSEVLRVSPDDRQQGAVALAAFLTDLDLPVAQPVRAAHLIDGFAITSWHWASSDANPDPAVLGQTIRALHSVPLDEVPDTIAVPWCGDFAHVQLGAMLEGVAPIIEPRHRVALADHIAALGNWEEQARQEPAVLCHGDVHLNNALFGADGLVLIDWDLLCAAPAAWDHAPLLAGGRRWGHSPDIYADFARGYGDTRVPDAPLTNVIVTLRNLTATVMMAARTDTDPVRAAEFERRMQHWHGHADAPPFRAQ